MKFILACLVASIVLPVAAHAQTCFNEPQGKDRVQAQPIIGDGTTFNGPQGQDRGPAQPTIVSGTTFNGPQGQDRGQAQPNIGGHRTYYGQHRCGQFGVR
jgi:hypothetical protein